MGDQLDNRLADLIRVGEVSSTNPKAHTARVVFPDDDNSTSYNLKVLVRNTYDNSDTNMPDIGEDVLCLFLPTGSADGYILGSFYAGQVTTPTQSQDQRQTRFKDGSTFTYDRSSHEYDIVIEGTHIHGDRQTVDITTPKTVNVKTTDVNVTATGNITLQASGNIDIKAGGVVTINGSSINLN